MIPYPTIFTETICFRNTEREKRVLLSSNVIEKKTTWCDLE